MNWQWIDTATGFIVGMIVMATVIIIVVLLVGIKGGLTMIKTILEDVLSPGELFIYKWQLNILGDFKTALSRAIASADNTNLHLLELGFPMEVSAYKCFAYQSGWWQEVEKKIEKWKEANAHNDNDNL